MNYLLFIKEGLFTVFIATSLFEGLEQKRNLDVVLLDICDPTDDLPPNAVDPKRMNEAIYLCKTNLDSINVVVEIGQFMKPKVGDRLRLYFVEERPASLSCRYIDPSQGILYQNLKSFKCHSLEIIE